MKISYDHGDFGVYSVPETMSHANWHCKAATISWLWQIENQIRAGR